MKQDYLVVGAGLYGALEYRSVCFETELLDRSSFQGNAAVNYMLVQETC